MNFDDTIYCVYGIPLYEYDSPDVLLGMYSTKEYADAALKTYKERVTEHQYDAYDIFERKLNLPLA